MTRRLLLFTLSVISSFAISAQEEKPTDSVPKGWNMAGEVSLLVNQSAFNHEWTGGGTSNYAGNLTINYELNYRLEKISWNNRLLVDYGLSRNKDDRYARKTNDRLELNSILGSEIQESEWFYSFFLNFKTQLSKGYDFNKDLDQTDPAYRTEKTHFMSPGYLKFGPGILWKKSDNLYVNIAPATAKFVFVDKRFTEVDETVPGAIEEYNKKKYFGVDANESSRFELGTAISGYAKFELMPNITAENLLSLYSNYLEEFKNVDIDYTLNLVMTVNQFITTNFTFQAIYDDNAARGFQIREALGVGLTYKF